MRIFPSAIGEKNSINPSPRHMIFIQDYKLYIVSLQGPYKLIIHIKVQISNFTFIFTPPNEQHHFRNLHESRLIHIYN